MEFTESEKEILEIVFRTAYSQIDILKEKGIDLFCYKNCEYNQNAIFNLADKLGIDL